MTKIKSKYFVSHWQLGGLYCTNYRARNSARSTDTVRLEMAIDRTKFVMTKHSVYNSCALQSISHDFCKNISFRSSQGRCNVPKFSTYSQDSQTDLRNKHLIASFNSRTNQKPCLQTACEFLYELLNFAASLPAAEQSFDKSHVKWTVKEYLLPQNFINYACESLVYQLRLFYYAYR